jgi:hypothetical protein
MNITKEKMVEQFCSNIEITATWFYNQEVDGISSNLRLYDENEKLEYIDRKRKEVREKLEKSDYKKTINLYVIGNELKKGLKRYFRSSPVSKSKGVEFDERLGKGVLVLNAKTGNMCVYPLKGFPYGNEPYFDFSELNIFKDLPKYIADCWVFTELKRLKHEIEKVNTDPQQQEINSDLKESPKYEQSTGTPMFPVIWDQNQLKKIWERSNKLKIIQSSEINFLCCFKGNGEPTEKIRWLLKGKQDKANKSALHWYCRKLNPNIEPANMNKVFNIEVDSHNNRYSPTKEMTDIFNNL